MLKAIMLIAILTLTGCASNKMPLIQQTTLPNQMMLAEPCRASDAKSNADDDLLADIETLECLALLRATLFSWQGWYRINFVENKK